MILEVRSLFHFILVLHSTADIQCWHYFSYLFLVWMFSLRDLFQVTGTEVNCVLYEICSQCITFEQVTLFSAYCAWFVALLASPYTVLLRTFPYLFLAQFDSSISIRIQFELL